MTPPQPVVVLSPGLAPEELRDAWQILSHGERLAGWKLLGRADAEELFLSLTAADQIELLLGLGPDERRYWIRLLAPDDAVDLVQEAPEEERAGLLALMDEPSRKEVVALLAYAEDVAGGLMNPRFAQLRADMTVDEAISYLRKQARELHEIIRYVYVVDPDHKLVGVVSFRQLFAAEAGSKVKDVMETDLVTVTEEMDQEAVGQLLAQHNLAAVPVVDSAGRMKGFVTVDDIVDVVHEEATEDIQKMGGTEALDAPYLQVGLAEMVRKRALWLSLLFLGQMLTVSAMQHYESELARAVVLALFIPLVISSGGNSGSQATTLVIRAMALGEVRLRDWFRVVRREIAAGVALGSILGTIGFLRVVLWPTRVQQYGEHYVLLGLTVAGSLVGVVMFGTIAGSMLPFVLRRLGLDPASASAPFVTTLVDVSGLVIYLTFASLLLTGTLL